MPGTAIFDMDRTLTRSGTWSRFMFSVNKARPLFYLRLPALAVHAAAYKFGLRSRRSVKEHGLETLTWATRDELERAADQFAENETRRGLRRLTNATLEKHRAAGDTLVMATAAVDLVARPIAKKLGIDIVICTELEWSEKGRLTGKLAGANCYGSSKLDSLRTANAVSEFPKPTTGYSDHVSDLPFLKWVDAGVAVNPSRGLALIADKAGLRVEDWETDKMDNEIL